MCAWLYVCIFVLDCYLLPLSRPHHSLSLLFFVCLFTRWQSSCCCYSLFFNVTRMCVPKNSCFLRSPKNFYQSFPHTYPFPHHVCWPNYYRPIPIGVEILIALRWFIHLPLIGRLHFTPEFRFVWNLSFSLFFVAAMQLAKTRSIYLWLALEFFHFNFYLVFATRFLARRIEPPSLYSGDCL